MTLNKEFYFSWNFVHPQAWEKVLKQIPDLTICLAHFGGDVWKDFGNDAGWVKDLVSFLEKYPNTYTDISYFFVKENKKHFKKLLQDHPQILDKIVFGTGWYLIEPDKYTYKKFCVETKKLLDDVGKDIGDNLWLRFSTVNAMRYLRLQERAEKFAEALKANSADTEIVDKGLSLLNRYDEDAFLRLASQAT